jgi:ABC-2 type transport system ATP-binding protein
MSALAAQGIRKSFGRRQVLAGVDLQVGAGQLVAVVGEDGTGKTTLLRILAGDLRPDAGSVAIDGRPGYCPQISTRSASFHNASGVRLLCNRS